ncbi:LacI family DNA-binding transcriptional regulator [Cohnella caldifontis]|uniref:LacI family DNA-binding transcriptional regulator n=1 Tax=Cohnella caldifontis TaxID=3027471 RepID=UPI0023EB58F7|nr:LacI family DNA-binding transcriptional regulator [Cohnella sp. YIM B05605]
MSDRRPSYAKGFTGAPRDGPPVIRTIAGALGISPSTVSRALNGVRGVKEATRKSVLEKAEEFGYVPHFGAKQLVGKGSRLVGVMMPEFEFEASNSFVHFLPLVQRELQRIGMDTLFFSVPLLSYSPGKLGYWIRSRGLEACMMLPAFTADHPLMREALALGIPCVNFEGAVGPRCSAIVSDDFEGGRMAGERLLKDGHRVIGHIRGPKELRISRERYAGFCQALRERGLEHPPDLLADGDFSGSSGSRAMTELLRRRTDLTAVFCGNDLMAAGALQALAGNGIPVPDRISVLGYDGDTCAAYTMPPLTTVRPARDLGAAKAVILLQRLLQGENGTMERVLPVLMERQSAARVPGTGPRKKGGSRTDGRHSAHDTGRRH